MSYEFHKDSAAIERLKFQSELGKWPSSSTPVKLSCRLLIIFTSTNVDLYGQR